MFNLKHWLVLIVIFAARCSAAGNVETRRSLLIQSPAPGSHKFGASMAIHKKTGTKNDLFVGAPHYGASIGNVKEGGVFKCEFDGSSNETTKPCSDINSISIDKKGDLGISVMQTHNTQSIIMCASQYFFNCSSSLVEQRLIGACYEHNVNLGTTISLSTPAPTECPRTELEIDIVFVLDESGSVKLPNYVVGLKWIINVLSLFRTGIDAGRVHVGLITFATYTRVQIGLGSRSYLALKDQISNTGYAEGATYTATAIRTATGQFRHYGRADVSHLMIVVTDGRTSDREKPDLPFAISEARTANIITTAVGIGGNANIDYSELLSIAGDAKRVFRVDDFANLNTILAELQNVIEETAEVTLEGASSNSTSELTQLQLGLATHISKDGNLHIGAVGAYDRMGTVVSFSGSNFLSGTAKFLDEAKLKQMLGPTNFTEARESYLGYSVTSGKFFGGSTIYVASGSPKFQTKGVVFIFNPQSSDFVSSKRLQLHPPSSSGLWQLGSYFGHSVCAVDLNNDLIDDLLVSAPLYSDQSGHDQGRVFVFLSNPSNVDEWASSSYKPQALQGSNAIGARFGMAIVAVGDLDKNNYQDVAIAAPFLPTSSSESGAVYVYYGSPAGLLESNKQEIIGKSVKTSLQYFGNSIISSDVNNDNYNDLIIAAQKSNGVIVLQTRPIVQVTASMTLRPQQIHVKSCLTNPSLNCGWIQFCVSAERRLKNSGSNVFGMDITLLLDSTISNPGLKRIRFLDGSYEKFFSQNIDQTEPNPCPKEMIKLHVEALTSAGIQRTLEQPLYVKLSYTFSRALRETISSPVLDVVVPNHVTELWGFDTKCTGAGGRCDHDLTAHATFDLYAPTAGDAIVLGRDPGTFTANVTVQNTGPDFSYFTKVNISYGAMRIKDIKGSCASLGEIDSIRGSAIISITNSSSVLNHLMMPGQKCKFVLEFDLNALTSTSTSDRISFSGNIYSNAGSTTAAFDPDQGNNKIQFMRKVLYATSLFLTGSSNPDAVFYNRSLTPNVTHTLLDPILGGEKTSVVQKHFIYNRGPVLFPTTSMTFSWPSATRSGLPLFYLYDFSCYPADHCRCDTTDKINLLNLPETNVTFTPTVPLKFPTDVVLPASPTCNDVLCGFIECSLIKIPSFLTITLTASFKVWLPTLSQENLATEFTSKIEIDAKNLPLYPPNKIYVNEVSTKVSAHGIPDSTQIDVTVNIGAIIGGIIGGLVLFAAVVAALWKMGFFKSKYGELKREAQRSIRRPEPPLNEPLYSNAEP